MNEWVMVCAVSAVNAASGDGEGVAVGGTGCAQFGGCAAAATGGLCCLPPTRDRLNSSLWLSAHCTTPLTAHPPRHPASPTKFATPLTSLSGNLSSFPFKCLPDYCGPLLQRGVGVAFGPDVAKAWLEGQGLQMVVRSHEVRGRLAGWRALGQAVGLL
jgi:hypothetical protein